MRSLISIVCIVLGSMEFAPMADEFRQTEITGAVSRTGLTRLQAHSDPELSAAEAKRGVRSRLVDELVREISSRTDGTMMDTEIRRRAVHIMVSKDVKQKWHPKSSDKSWGTYYRCHLMVDVPDALIDQAITDLERTRRLRKVRHAATPGIVLLVGLFGVMLMIKLDRLTQGYRRPAVVFGVLLGISSTAAGALMIF